MKKIISVLAITAFTFGYSQEVPKKSCCSSKDKKECKTDDKKADKKTAKSCDDKDHKDCKGSCDAKKEKAVQKKSA